MKKECRRKWHFFLCWKNARYTEKNIQLFRWFKINFTRTEISTYAQQLFIMTVEQDLFMRCANAWKLFAFCCCWIAKIPWNVWTMPLHSERTRRVMGEVRIIIVNLWHRFWNFSLFNYFVRTHHFVSYFPCWLWPENNGAFRYGNDIPILNK